MVERGILNISGIEIQHASFIDNVPRTINELYFIIVFDRMQPSLLHGLTKEGKWDAYWILYMIIKMDHIVDLTVKSVVLAH